MKRISFFVFINVFFCLTHAAYLGQLFKLAPMEKGAQIILSEYEEKKQYLSSLEDERKEFETKIKEKEDEHKKLINDLENALNDIKIEKSKSSVLELEFLSKQETLLTEIKQSLNDSLRNTKQSLYYLKKDIDALEQYVNNPMFEDLRVQEKTSYQFEEFQSISKRLLSAEDELNRHKDEKKRLEGELSKTTAQVDQLAQELKQKEKEQQSFSPSKNSEVSVDEFRKKSVLLDLEVRLLKRKMESLDQKRLELQRELDLSHIQIFAVKKRVDLFKKDLARVDRKLWVSDADIQEFQKTIDDKKQENAKRQAKHAKEITTLTTDRDNSQKEFEELNEALPASVKDVRQLSEWLIEPNSVGDEVGFYKVAFAHDQLQIVDRRLALALAKQDLNSFQVSSLELQVEIMKTWLMITQRRLMGDDEDRQDKLSFFNTKRNEIERELNDFKNKDNAIANLMSIESRALSQIKLRREKLQSSKAKFVKQYGESSYKQALELLNKSQEKINQQIDLNGQLIKAYSSVVAILTDMKQQIDVVTTKLEALGGIWQRAAGAVTWEGIKSTIPELQFFWEDLVNIFSQPSVQDVSLWFRQLFTSLSILLNLLFIALLLIALYFLLAVTLPLTSKVLVKKQKKYGWQLFVNSVATLLQFFHDHLLDIFIWASLFVIIRYGLILEIGVRAKVIFYLLSIPYLCYIARAFILFYIENNKKFISGTFQARLSKVLQFFLFSTIIIYFFREAFLITTYGRSEIPTILLAIYSIITRASLVFLIMTKELIIDALPSRGKIWNFAKEQIDHYYNLFLVVIIALIIMSDPFVGYGRLVSVVLQGAFWTILIIVTFWWLQRSLKQYSAYIFFVETGEGLKERFSYAKTWYALFIVLSFAILIGVTALFLAKTWGYPVSFESIRDFFNFEIVPVRGDVPGEIISVTPRSIMVLIAFIFGGFFIASMFNRYVLDRIYNLLQVDMGVQNTVSRISSYFIVIIIVVIGLSRVGLGNWIPYALGFLAVGFAFAIKGPADDFVAYFIILVERSIKIGDYIRLDRIDSEVSGVVRKITPRSVILRKKNSYNLIIPNSKITKSYILNWNYARGYLAFEDMKIVVSYDADPIEVKDVFLKVLEENSAILKSPQPIIRITNFALNGYQFMVRGYVSSSNVLNQWDICSDIRFAVTQAFKKHGIKLAVPVCDVKLESVEIKKTK